MLKVSEFLIGKSFDRRSVDRSRLGGKKLAQISYEKGIEDEGIPSHMLGR